MQDLPTHEFGRYVFRPATEEDLPTAQRWNAYDPDHTWEAQIPRYWIEQNIAVNSYALEDPKGIGCFVKSIRHPRRRSRNNPPIRLHPARGFAHQVQAGNDRRVWMAQESTPRERLPGRIFPK